MHPSQVVIGHPTCDLHLQRRIRDARREAVARSVLRMSGRRTVLDRILRRGRADPGERPLALDVGAFRDDGEDVWKSLRF
jgi:hypothetical protein